MKEFGGDRGGGRDNVPQDRADDQSGGQGDGGFGPQADAPTHLEPTVEERVRTHAPQDERSKIAERFRNQREQEDKIPLEQDETHRVPFARQGGRGEDLDETADETDTGQRDEAGNDAEPDRREPDRAAEAPTYRLKVRGEERQVTREQLLASADLTPEDAEGMSDAVLTRIAQKNEAANSYLAEAREKERSSRRQADPPPAPRRGDADTDDEPDELGRDAPVDRIREAAEKLQFGEPGEAADALRKAINDELGAAEITRARNRLGRDHQAEIDSYIQANPDITNDDDYGALLLQRSAQEIRDEFVRKGIGSREEVDANMSDPKIAAALYKEARLQGHDVKSPGEILEAAGKGIRQKFNLPNPVSRTDPQPSTQSPGRDRQAEKRDLPTQPTRTSVPVQAQGSAPLEQSRSSAVQEMRKARGQSAR